MDEYKRFRVVFEVEADFEHEDAVEEAIRKGLDRMPEVPYIDYSDLSVEEIAE